MLHMLENILFLFERLDFSNTDLLHSIACSIDSLSSRAMPSDIKFKYLTCVGFMALALSMRPLISDLFFIAGTFILSYLCTFFLLRIEIESRMDCLVMGLEINNSQEDLQSLECRM